MMSGLNAKSRTIALFVGANVAVVLLATTFFIAPILSHFAERGEEITENRTQLARFQNMIERGKAAAKTLSARNDVFLPGQEERLVSADLQANLKSIATSAGVNLLAVRGAPSGQVQKLHLVAVAMEAEGSLVAMRDLMRSIESQTPALLITSISLRSAVDGEDRALRAELTVMGAIRDIARSDGPDAAQ